MEMKQCIKFFAIYNLITQLWQKKSPVEDQIGDIPIVFIVIFLILIWVIYLFLF